jgi:sulfur carrier protein
MPKIPITVRMMINGRNENVAEGMTAKEYLDKHGYDASKTAILLNGKIVPRAEFGSTPLSDGDSMEIVSFVGGG